jgi:hypothetical protein
VENDWAVLEGEQGGRGEAPELDQAMLDALKAIGY